MSSNIVAMVTSRRLRWTEHIDMMVETSNAYRSLLRKVYGKRLRNHQLGRKGME
jgi:hypothetical protein